MKLMIKNPWITVYFISIAIHLIFFIGLTVYTIFWPNEMIQLILNTIDWMMNLVYALGTYMLYRKVHLPSQKNMQESFERMMKSYNEWDELYPGTLPKPINHFQNDKFKYLYFGVIGMNMILFFLNATAVI